MYSYYYVSYFYGTNAKYLWVGSFCPRHFTHFLSLFLRGWIATYGRRNTIEYVTSVRCKHKLVGIGTQLTTYSYEVQVDTTKDRASYSRYNIFWVSGVHDKGTLYYFLIPLGFWREPYLLVVGSVQ